VTTDAVAAALVGLLTDEGRKPPRVLARIVADHLAARGYLGSTSRTVVVDCQACQTPPPWGDPLDWMDREQVVVYARHLERFADGLLAERADKRRRTA
jgi:hypothetical protein